MGRFMSIQKREQIDKWVDKWMGGWIYKQMDKWMGGWMNDGWVDLLIDGQVGGQMAR